MDSKILLALVVIGIAGFAVGYGTVAYFVSVQSGDINIQAGEVSSMLEKQCTYFSDRNPVDGTVEPYPCNDFIEFRDYGPVEYSGMEERTTFVDIPYFEQGGIADIKDTIVNTGNDAWVCVILEVMDTSDEPGYVGQAETGLMSSMEATTECIYYHDPAICQANGWQWYVQEGLENLGELQRMLTIWGWVDDCNFVPDLQEHQFLPPGQTFGDYGLNEVGERAVIRIADSEINLLHNCFDIINQNCPPMASGEQISIMYKLQLNQGQPIEIQPGLVVDEANIVMRDSLKLVEKWVLVQAANNPNFKCSQYGPLIDQSAYLPYTGGGPS